MAENNDVYLVWSWMEDFFEQHPADPPANVRLAAMRVLGDPEQTAKLGWFLATEIETPYERGMDDEEDEENPFAAQAAYDLAVSRGEVCLETPYCRCGRCRPGEPIEEYYEHGDA